MHACWNAAELEDAFVVADSASCNAAWAATQNSTVMPNDNGISAARLTAEQSIQCSIVRDVFAPFVVPNVHTGWLAWNNVAITAIAQTIYQDRAFDRLPILADALEDADCTNTAILEHCRGPGPHVRGCWVVDLLLGKN